MQKRGISILQRQVAAAASIDVTPNFSLPHYIIANPQRSLIAQTFNQIILKRSNFLTFTLPDKLWTFVFFKS